MPAEQALKDDIYNIILKSSSNVVSGDFILDSLSDWEKIYPGEVLGQQVFLGLKQLISEGKIKQQKIGFCALYSIDNSPRRG